MNIILLIWDSLRKDCVGAYGAPPWGKVHTPHLDAFAAESLLMTRTFPESLPTLPARRALYTGRRVYPFHDGDFCLKGDFLGAPGWGPIPEEQPTLAEMLGEAGYRTGLISDVYHMFKPSKNFWRGFDQWLFLRGQESDPARSGPHLSQAEIERWLPEELRADGRHSSAEFVQQCIMNIHDRRKEEDYFAPRVLKEAALWLEENQDADRFFLTVESFDPHEPWLVPQHYSRMYLARETRQQIVSTYREMDGLPPDLLARTRANYSGLVTMCDRWFGFFIEALRVLGLLDNTAVIVTSDHGHSIAERNYLGKRGYPSVPEVYAIPLMIRFPGAQHAGRRSDAWVQHHDVTAAILELAGCPVHPPVDGVPFLDDACNGRPGSRRHVTVGWGSTPTVITERWWFNAKMDGTGVLLYDLAEDEPFERNAADEQPDVAATLLAQARADAGGEFPAWLVALARIQADAPGCSALAARS